MLFRSPVNTVQLLYRSFLSRPTKDLEFAEIVERLDSVNLLLYPVEAVFVFCYF